MGRRSKVELSPNKDDYIKMKLAGASLTGLSDEAHKRGENISPMSFSRFFNKVDVNVHQAVKERLEQATNNSIGVKRSHDNSVSVVKEITRNLYTLQTLTQSLIQNNPTDAKTVNACTQLLKETRLTLEYLDRKRKDMILESEQSEEMAIATLMSILDHIPLNCPHCGGNLEIIERIEKELVS